MFWIASKRHLVNREQALFAIVFSGLLDGFNEVHQHRVMCIKHLIFSAQTDIQQCLPCWLKRGVQVVDVG